ncbi:helix-turn-helix domain-containing protein [Halostagnicola sp. A-GB9-2]|uniref:helix-turn-helix domain-containing protein n=1 Tax=Halostagnicola sp. A-GB9-2 TaxID=3048066 RepID=UPI0024C00876|nr:helix-turn-helix domain-containing protein [Halostagnicola sp. A-GB9-2]MDJ1433051.1 helix-turn-helix domain-containing protein [Halostagnicola sp. A-GB9-2]
MRKPGPWMQNPTDERILEVLNTGLELGPTTIARNIDRHRTGVNRRLSTLVEYGLVSRVDEGYYEISDLGEQYLAGDLDAADLEPTE